MPFHWLDKKYKVRTSHTLLLGNALDQHECHVNVAYFFCGVDIKFVPIYLISYENSRKRLCKISSVCLLTISVLKSLNDIFQSAVYRMIDELESSMK